MKRLIDWYWSHGQKRKGEHRLPRGTWLDSVYGIVGRREILTQLDAASGKKHALGIWGPSQTGKSTMLARFLDRGRTDSIPSSPCLTWDSSSPVTFLSHDATPSEVTVLNPYNQGNDGTGCVTRYISATFVPHPKHPVRIHFNSVPHLMHALACGYLTECKNPPVGIVTWDREKIDQVFLDASLNAGATVNRQAYELMRELMHIVELFIASEHPRYLNLRNHWDDIRNDFLESSPALTSVDEVIRVARRLLWDDAPAISDCFDRLRLKSSKMPWGRGDVYCTYQVASLLIDIDTYRKSISNTGNARESKVREAVARIGFRTEGNDVLIECGTPSSEISGPEFGVFQALVRELVIPVKSPAGEKDAFFRLIETCDLIDFPGVALQDVDATSASLLDAFSGPSIDAIWLTRVFKRGKTASMVLGYAQEVAIDAFAILVKSKEFPAKPRQLTTGIVHWWQCVDRTFDPNASTATTRTPLPLSICLTFFARFINDEIEIKSGTGMESNFSDMLGKLSPLTIPGNATLFSTTYKDFATKGAFQGSAQAVAQAANFIRADASFQRAFSSEESRQSFERMLADADGGVGYFLEQQLAAINGSKRRAKLSQIDSTDRQRLVELLEEALPTGDDVGALQKRVLKRVLDTIRRNLRDWAERVPRERTMFDVEDATSLYGFWIRQLTYVKEEDLEKLPQNYARLTMEQRRSYVEGIWDSWKASVLKRMITVHGFDWSVFGLEGEADALVLLRLLSEQRPAAELVRWMEKELGFVNTTAEAKALRRELAVAMGNIMRKGVMFVPATAGQDPVQLLHQQVRWEDGDLAERSPHNIAVIDGFLEVVETIKPAEAKRPPQDGDDDLRNLRPQLS
jgi:hypothetical protein